MVDVWLYSQLLTTVTLCIIEVPSSLCVDPMSPMEWNLSILASRRCRIPVFGRWPTLNRCYLCCHSSIACLCILDIRRSLFCTYHPPWHYRFVRMSMFLGLKLRRRLFFSRERGVCHHFAEVVQAALFCINGGSKKITSSSCFKRESKFLHMHAHDVGKWGQLFYVPTWNERLSTSSAGWKCRNNCVRQVFSDATARNWSTANADQEAGQFLPEIG